MKFLSLIHFYPNPNTTFIYAYYKEYNKIKTRVIIFIKVIPIYRSGVAPYRSKERKRLH